MLERLCLALLMLIVAASTFADDQVGKGEVDNKTIENGATTEETDESKFIKKIAALKPPYAEKDLEEIVTHLWNYDCTGLETITTDQTSDALNAAACRFFEKDAIRAQNLFSGCFGSNKDNFLPQCKDYKTVDRILPQVTQFISTLGHIHGFGTCGSIRYGHYSSHNGAINRMLHAGSNFETPDKFVALEQSVGEERFEFLEAWSQQGIWEKRTYKEYNENKAKAVNELATYYKKKNGWTDAIAEKIAKHEIGYLASSYFLISSSYNAIYLTLTDLQRHIETKEKGTNQSHLNALLKVAILTDAPLNIIGKLVEEGAQTNGNISLEVNIFSPVHYGFETPLMVAVLRPEVVKWLIANGADVNMENGFGKTALMYAVQYNAIESAKELLKAGANPNAFTKDTQQMCSGYNISAYSRTPLMYAAWHGTPDGIKLLLDSGAKLDVHDSKGHDAAYYLQRNDNNLSAKELEQAKALLAIQ